jgi:hypothetical protein
VRQSQMERLLRPTDRMGVARLPVVEPPRPPADRAAAGGVGRGPSV